MKTEVLLKLIDAGYSKEEISLMEETENKQAAQPAEPEAAAQPEEAAAQPAETAPADPAEDSAQAIADIMQIIVKMQKTLDGLQHKNAAVAEGSQPEKMTADRVIKDFFGEKKKA